MSNAAPYEYRIVERMAAGSFGVVFKVRRVLDDAVLVMKRIPLLELSRTERGEAAQEMFLMGSLHHPYIVAQRDAFLFNDNDLCLIMDYYDGGDLDLALTRQRELDQYFSLDKVMTWFVQMVLALQYLHSHGILHRDLKAHNLFLSKRTDSIAVGDFGVAEKIDAEKANAIAAAATWRQQQTMLRRRSFSSDVSRDALPERATSHPPLPAAPAPVAAAAAEERGGASGPVWSPNTSGMLNGAGLTAPPPPSLGVEPRVTSAGSPTFASRAPTPLPVNSAFSAALAPSGGEGDGKAAVMKGTPMYMAPEALQGDAGSASEPIGPASDVWSLGCILYELLTLRHPFESRDIGALVMRVTHGEREPLPAHYPPAVHELVDRLLQVDPKRRPFCSEILQTPLACAYLQRVAAQHVPADVPQSAEETALAKQLARFLVPGMAEDSDGGLGSPSAKNSFTREKSSSVGDADTVGWRFFSRQVTTPVCSPLEEREAVEQKRHQAAQQAAVSMLRLSGSLRSTLGTGASGGTCSSLSLGAGMPNNISSAGTFFVGGTTPFDIVPMGGERPRPPHHAGEEEDEGTESSTVVNSVSLQRGGLAALARDGAAGKNRYAQPAAPHGVQRSPRHGSRAGNRSPSVVDDSDGSGRHERSPPMSGPRRDRALSSPLLPRAKKNPPWGRRPQLPRRSPPRKSSEEGRPPRAGAARASPRTSQSPRSPPRGRPVSASLEESFFHAHRNVRDMRAAPVAAIAEAVLALRHQLQDALRERERQRDATQLRFQFGDELAQTMPQTFREAKAAPSSSLHGVAGGAPAAGDESAAEGDHDSPLLRALTGSGPAPSEVEVADVRLLSAAARDRAAVQPRLAAYLHRRANLVAAVSRELPPDVLGAVYTYYRHTSVAARDPRVVQRLVPQRTAWTALPLVADMVALDRFLENGAASSTSSPA